MPIGYTTEDRDADRRRPLGDQQPVANGLAFLHGGTAGRNIEPRLSDQLRPGHFVFFARTSPMQAASLIAFAARVNLRCRR